MAEEKLDSTALRIIRRVAKSFSAAHVSLTNQVMVDGSEKIAVTITMPIDFKSGRGRMLFTLFASEMEPGEIQLTRLPYVGDDPMDIKRWIFPKSAQEHIKLFVEEYNKRNYPDLIITQREEGLLDVSYFFLLKGMSDVDVYNQIRLCIAHNLDVDGRLTIAETGNMDGIIDYIGAAKGSNDDETDKRMSI